MAKNLSRMIVSTPKANWEKGVGDCIADIGLFEPHMPQHILMMTITVTEGHSCRRLLPSQKEPKDMFEVELDSLRFRFSCQEHKEDELQNKIITWPLRQIREVVYHSLADTPDTKEVPRRIIIVFDNRLPAPNPRSREGSTSEVWETITSGTEVELTCKLDSAETLYNALLHRDLVVHRREQSPLAQQPTAARLIAPHAGSGDGSDVPVRVKTSIILEDICVRSPMAHEAASELNPPVVEGNTQGLARDHKTAEDDAPEKEQNLDSASAVARSATRKQNEQSSGAYTPTSRRSYGSTTFTSYEDYRDSSPVLSFQEGPPSDDFTSNTERVTSAEAQRTQPAASKDPASSPLTSVSSLTRTEPSPHSELASGAASSHNAGHGASELSAKEARSGDVSSPAARDELTQEDFHGGSAITAPQRAPPAKSKTIEGHIGEEEREAPLGTLPAAKNFHLPFAGRPEATPATNLKNTAVFEHDSVESFTEPRQARACDRLSHKETRKPLVELKADRAGPVHCSARAEKLAKAAPSKKKQLPAWMAPNRKAELEGLITETEGVENHEVQQTDADVEKIRSSWGSHAPTQVSTPPQSLKSITEAEFQRSHRGKARKFTPKEVGVPPVRVGGDARKESRDVNAPVTPQDRHSKKREVERCPSEEESDGQGSPSQRVSSVRRVRRRVAASETSVPQRAAAVDVAGEAAPQRLSIAELGARSDQTEQKCSGGSCSEDTETAAGEDSGIEVMHHSPEQGHTDKAGHDIGPGGVPTIDSYIQAQLKAAIEHRREGTNDAAHQHPPPIQEAFKQDSDEPAERDLKASEILKDIRAMFNKAANLVEDETEYDQDMSLPLAEASPEHIALQREMDEIARELEHLKDRAQRKEAEKRLKRQELILQRHERAKGEFEDCVHDAFDAVKNGAQHYGAAMVDFARMFGIPRI
ncbi:unnamed protein product [Parajaminaea phylloscopi]